MKWLKHYSVFLIALFLVACIYLLLVLIDPIDVVDSIGVQNTYLFLFVFAAIGGLSTFTVGAFYSTFVTFILGGSHPVLLSFAGGLGLLIGDSLFYVLGLGSRTSLSGVFKKSADRISRWISGQKDPAIMLFIFLYSAITPLPSDLLMISLSLVKYPYKKAVVPAVLGNITLLLLLSLAALAGLGHLVV
ncbi:MAG: hypothetical protein ACLFTH_03110 [Candidatus Woesearchaeota archaeon]